MNSWRHAQGETLPHTGDFAGGFQHELSRLARQYTNGWATLDIAFLAYLLKTSRFGFFAFGPVTIDVRLIEDLVERTSRRYPDTDTGETTYADDFIEFSRLLMEEVRRSGRRRMDELHYLLAFMRVGQGLPARVFAELGVTPEQVEAYVRGMRQDPTSNLPEERLYSPEEAAEYLSVHVKTVRSWIRSGRLRASRLAGQRALRIRASDLNAVLEEVEPSDV